MMAAALFSLAVGFMTCFRDPIRLLFAKVPATTPGLHARLHCVLSKIEALRDVGHAVGVSIGVVSAGQVVLDHHLGFADVERRVVANASTRYTIASLTKAFVTATVAQLVDDELLSWEGEGDSVAHYLPGLVFRDDCGLSRQLTLVDLLSHRTGLARLDALWLGAEGDTLVAKADTVAACGSLAPVCPARTRLQYNNWMYAVVGEIIERATDQPWGTVLAERVLRPLGLSQTTAVAAEVPPDTAARFYMVLDDGRAALTNRVGLAEDTVMGSAGGIRSTVHDLLAWGRTLLALRDDGDTAAAAAADAATTAKTRRPVVGLGALLSGHSFINSTPASDELYGMGFAKVTTPASFGKLGFNPGLVGAMPVIAAAAPPQRVFYHNGAGAGHNHCLMLVPASETVIVVLTNSLVHGDVADWIAQTLLQAVLDVPVPVDLLPFAKHAADQWCDAYRKIKHTLYAGYTPPKEPPPPEALVGRYWHTSRALVLNVFQDPGPGGALRFNINGRREQQHTLTPYANDTFVFLPSAEERMRRALFHYTAASWLLHFEHVVDGRYIQIAWNLDEESLAPERFVRDADGDMHRKGPFVASNPETSVVTGLE